MWAIEVNTKMNFRYFVEQDAIYEELNNIFSSNKNIKLIGKIEIKLNRTKTNVFINLSYKLINKTSFAYETKKLIFKIEHKVFSLINAKPNNINLIFQGYEDEK